MITSILLSSFFFLFSLLICIISIGIAKKYKFCIDDNKSTKPQKSHDISTPRIGGLGIVISFNVAMLFFSFIYGVLFFHLFLSSLIIFISGFLEDALNRLSPKIRLSFQTIATIYILLNLNIYLENLNLGFDLPLIIAFLFSLFCIVGCCNAINIIDGLNGLGGGISILILVSIAMVSYHNDFELISLISFLLSFCILGFLVLNFPYAKIFLGDGGAYLIGFVISILLIMLSQSQLDTNSLYSNFIKDKVKYVSAWYGFSIMIYPVWEVIFSIIRRKIAKKRAMQPDGKHLHQLLYKLLKNNPKSSIIIILYNIPFIAISSFFYYRTDILIFISLIFILMYIAIYIFLLKKINMK